MSTSRRLAATLALTLATSTVVVPAHAETVSDTASATVTTATDFDAAYAAWEADRDAARAALDDATAEAERATAALSEAESELADAESALADAEQRVRDADDAVEQAERDNQAAYDAEIARLTDAVRAAESEKDAAAIEEANAREAWSAASAEVHAANTHRNTTRAELNRTNFALDDLKWPLESKLDERDRLIGYRDYWANHRFSQAEYERITAQAIVEMVNDYRRANGLAALRTHALYNQQAGNWSRNMAKNGFRHSPKEWGRSNENIASSAYHSPANMTAEQWGRLADSLFYQWRTSPDGHNQTMLGSQYQGIGVGIAFDDNGRAYATTMFFIEDTKLTDGSFYYMDGMTKAALNSGEPFYRAVGAKRLLGQSNWTAPSNPGNATVDNSKILGGRDAQMRKLQGLAGRVDAKVDMSKRADPAKAAEISAKVDTANREYNELAKQYNDLGHKKANLQLALKRAEERADAAYDRERPLLDAWNAAEEALENASRKLDEAQAALEKAPAQPEAVSSEVAAAPDQARAAVAQKEGTRNAAREAAEKHREAVTAAEDAERSARADYDEVVAAEPQRPATPVASEETQAPEATGERVASESPVSKQPAPDNAPQWQNAADNEGSSAGTVIGVILALLAVVGVIAAVATNMQK